MKGSVQITINTSPEKLYDHLIDFRNHVAWNHQLVEVKQVTPDPIQVGTIFSAEEQGPANMPEWLVSIMMAILRTIGIGDPKTRATITELLPNQRIAWTAQNPIEGKPNMKAHWVLTFAPQGEATLVTQLFEMAPQTAVTRLMSNKKLEAQIIAGCHENLGKLKAMIEAQ